MDFYFWFTITALVASKCIADFTTEKLFIWFYVRNALKIEKEM